MLGKCEDCKFCFSGEIYGYVCGGTHYDDDITDSISLIKECYSEGLDAFIENLKADVFSFEPGTKLGQLKIDGRHNIEVVDQVGKGIRIKASNAKLLMGDLIVVRRELDKTYVVNTIFDPAPFRGQSYLIVT